MSGAPHATLVKFGSPGSVVADFEHWAVVLRNQQVTLGSLVLICKEDATAFPSISSEAFAELKHATAVMEGMLAAAFSFDKLNYLMLRMVDPHVHFHVIPRYEAARTFEGVTFEDRAWPKPPDLSAGADFPERLRAPLRAYLQDRVGKADRIG